MFKRKTDEQKELIKKAIGAGLLEVIFIMLVGFYFIVAEDLFPANSGSLIFGIISVLVLLVLGVAVSAVLVFGLPACLFFQKKYKEASISVAVTLSTLLVVFILIILGEIFVF